MVSCQHVDPSVGHSGCFDRHYYGGFCSAAADNFAVNPTHGDNPNVGDCDNQNLTSHVCVADSTVHTVGMDLGPLMTEATNATLFESYDTTNLTIVDGFSHTETVDVWYYVNDALPEGVVGANRCNVANTSLSDSSCNHSHVAYHGDYLQALGWNGSGTLNENRRRKLACHETGHTVGLTHGVDAHPTAIPNTNVNTLQCMVQGTYDSPPIGVGGHNVAHIQSWYL